VQRCSFLIMEQCCGPLAVEIFTGKQESTEFQHLSYQESESSDWRMRRDAFF
jgi:hypothetical protein